MRHWEIYLAKLAFSLLVLAGLGPLVGRATLGQTVALALLVAAGFHLIDFFLLPRLLGSIGREWFALGEGLLAAALLRALAPPVGAAYGWSASIVLGLVLGVSEFLLHRWEGIGMVGRAGP